MSLSRRHWMVGGVAAGAGLAGAGVAWWRQRELAAEQAPVQAFWDASFEQPGGGSLSMKSLRGRPLLVNFWATWCPPCIDELPLIEQFHRENFSKSWQVVGLAVDQPSAVRSFLGRGMISFAVGLAGLEGTELSASLGNAAGGLPFTVVFAADGQVLDRRVGRVTPADLERWKKAV